MVNAAIERGQSVPVKVRRNRRLGAIASATTKDAAGGERLIPEPQEPLFPILSLKGLLTRSATKVPSIVEHGDFIELIAGRYAIGIALDLLGVSVGDEVLVPACHCTAMIDPIVAKGATPVFYKIDRLLNVDIADAGSKVTPKTKAIMASHMFGFPQDGPALRNFADQHGIALIEDCAHAFFGDGMGTYGDFVIGSSRKFFPIAQGGCLVTRHPGLRGVKLQSRGLVANLRDMLTLIERSLKFGRLWLLDPPLTLLERLRGKGKPIAEAENLLNPEPPPEEREIDYFPEEEHLGISGLSKLLWRMTSPGWVARKRRENYRKLLELVGESPGVRPLFPDLPDTVVPFMAAFWVDRLEEVFPSLEDAALPMQRYGQFLWEGVDETVCPVSVDMSRHLIQLACHQDLTDAELRRIAGAFREIVLREN